MIKRPPSPRSGIALVLVLGMLVLMSVLLLAFFATVTTERTASQSGADGASARQHAETTVNLVLAQIRDATNNPAGDRAWASQPGAIRSYATPSGAGDDRAQNLVYKLYSAEVMREKESDYQPQNDTSTVVAGNIPTLAKADFTDLNAPVFVQEGMRSNGTPVWQPHFPIIDPRAKADINGATTADPKKRLVEGFECADFTMLDPNGTTAPVLPLPVKWLYILRDGSIGPASKATKANPMVARTAFWTDDESAKLNINTASEGSFWDTPFASSVFESGDVDTSGRVVNGDRLNLAVAQPTKREYQRYPGHPATTSLSPVLRRMFPAASGTASFDVNFKTRLYQILPHLTGGAGSSEAGSVNPSAPISGMNQSPMPPLVDDRERLYANVDELAFQPTRWNVGTKKPVENLELTPALIERAGFFLTAQSRAPELNLFGRPRVAIWPVPKDEAHRTAYDKLFAFTSTFAGEQGKPASAKPYYFIRDTNSATTSNPTPGSRSMTSDYGLTNAAGKARNKEIYAYLQHWMGKNVPGYGGSFLTKYGTDSDQILTEIYDYIRCTNLVDGTTGAKQYTPPYRNTDTDTDESNSKPKPNEWAGQVAPIRIGTTQGFGRFNTVTEAAILFYATANSQGKKADDTTQMRAVLLFEFATPMPGYTGLRDSFSFRVRCDKSLTAAGTTLFSSGKNLGYNIVDVDALNSAFGRAHTANRGFTLAMLTFPGANSNSIAKSFQTGNPTTADKTKYPYVSAPITTTSAVKSFTMSSAAFTMEIFATTNPSANEPVVQTITFDFPAVSQLPKANMPKNPADNAGVDGDEFRGIDFEKRVREGRKDSVILANEDTVRSVEVGGNAKGDYRLVAARQIVPKEFFAARKPGYDSAQRQVHGLKFGHGDPYPGATAFGNFAKDAKIRADKPPDVPTGINGVERRGGGWGDWDRGVSKHPDGPFCNRPDDGNLYFDLGQSGFYRLPYFHGPTIRQVNDTYYTPNRLISSPVMFGSLPTGVLAEKPWQTLLFRPDRRAPGESSDHPGAGQRGISPADYLLLDLFHMPIVEPYAISEPGSTAGKVNLNFAIAPFGYATVGSAPYVKRDTALRGVLKPVKIMAVSAAMGDGGHTESLPDITCRYDIDADATLADLQKRFDDPQQGLFRSAGEVCDVDLYPKKYNSSTDPRGYQGTIPAKKADFGQFWWDNRLTGDNCRERPYSMIYPRVTTKSNVFTVHLRVQVIAKAAGSAPNVFDESKDRIASEYRGSSMIERFLDPNDAAMKNWDELNDSLDPYYRFRVVSTKRFQP